MLKTSRNLLWLVLIFIALSGCATTVPSPPAASDKPTATRIKAAIRIGAVIGLSGDIAVYGESQRKGMELAAKELNTGEYLGPTRLLEVVVLDSGASVEGASAAMTRLIQEYKAAGILGPTLSSQAFAADPMAQKNGVPVIAISNTVPKITEMGDFIFRCSLPESSVIAGTIGVASKSFNIRKVGILWGKDEDVTIASYQAFRDAIKKNGIEVLADETFRRGDADFKTQLSKIIALYPDAIVASALVKEASQVVMQARNLGFKGTIIGGNGFNSPELIKQAGEAAEGVVGTAWNMDSPAPKNVEFISAFEKTYGIKPDQFAAQAYTSVKLYAAAITRAGSPEPKAIRDALAGMRNFDCPLGSFSFDENREPVHSSAVQAIRAGKFVIINK